MRTDAAADIRLDAVLENCIFYISSMYEFSHSLGHSRPSWSRLASTFVRFSNRPVPTQNSESQKNAGVSPPFRVLSRDTRENGADRYQERCTLHPSPLRLLLWGTIREDDAVLF